MGLTNQIVIREMRTLFSMELIRGESIEPASLTWAARVVVAVKIFRRPPLKPFKTPLSTDWTRPWIPLLNQLKLLVLVPSHWLVGLTLEKKGTISKGFVVVPDNMYERAISVFADISQFFSSQTERISDTQKEKSVQ